MNLSKGLLFCLALAWVSLKGESLRSCPSQLAQLCKNGATCFAKGAFTQSQLTLHKHKHRGAATEWVELLENILCLCTSGYTSRLCDEKIPESKGHESANETGKIPLTDGCITGKEVGKENKQGLPVNCVHGVCRKFKDEYFKGTNYSTKLRELGRDTKSKVCVCEKGFTALQCDKECPPGTAAPYCVINCPPLCKGKKCDTKGRCKKCEGGFEGKYCNKTAPCVDKIVSARKLTSRNCFHGKCVKRGGGKKCACGNSYQGWNCKEKCNGTTLTRHLNGTFETHYFYGPYCHIRCGHCLYLPCDPDGTCMEVQGKRCTPGYSGKSCDKPVSPQVRTSGAFDLTSKTAPASRTLTQSELGGLSSELRSQLYKIRIGLTRPKEVRVSFPDKNQPARRKRQAAAEDGFSITADFNMAFPVNDQTTDSDFTNSVTSAIKETSKTFKSSVIPGLSIVQSSISVQPAEVVAPSTSNDSSSSKMSWFVLLGVVAGILAFLVLAVLVLLKINSKQRKKAIVRDERTLKRSKASFPRAKSLISKNISQASGSQVPSARSQVV